MVNIFENVNGIISFTINTRDIVKTEKPKVMGMDFDWTLVKPKENRPFPKDKDDWMWLRPNIPDIIKEYFEKGFLLYIFTNQTKEWKQAMIYTAISTLNLPVKVVVAYGKTEFVKPNPELFWYDKMLGDFDKNESFFVGDAAGGVEWSDSDLKFAENVGITFKTPEEIFPITLVHHLQNDTQEYFKDSPEMVILVGYQAIGKTTFAENKFVPHGYIRIDGDSLKTPAKMIKESEKQLKIGKSVVIDATNGKKENRELFINLAKKYNVFVRCFVFNTSIETAMEWNTKRFVETGKKIPKIAFYTFRKNYNPPTISECPIVNI